MKLTKKETVLVALAVISASVCGGFFIGRDSRRETVVTVGRIPPAVVEEADAERFSPALPSDKPSVTPAAPEAGGARININSAAAEDLVLLPGIGDAIAERIIAYREENGAFASCEDLMNVKGIGPKVYEKLKDYITV